MAKDKFTDIYDILNDYSKDISEGIHKKGDEVAKYGVNKLKNTTSVYHVRSGDYNKGWKVKEYTGMWSFKNTIHNATDWRLTHLLEFSHNKRNGGKTKAFPHIEPVEKECVNDYENGVRKLIKNGGK